MTVPYMCPACDQGYGRPKESPHCMSEYCGELYKEVKHKVEY